MKYSGYTNYPITRETYGVHGTDDISGQEAPWRKCEIISYDFDKYCRVKIDGLSGIYEIKLGYIKKTIDGQCYLHKEMNGVKETVYE